MAQQHMRSPFARANALGSAKEGVEHWWRERVTAVALIPLTLWFAVSMITHSAGGYTAVVAWLGTPFNTLMMTILLVALFYHTALGLQVIIEDYVHSAAKLPILVAVNLGCFALAATGIFALMRIAFAR